MDLKLRRTLMLAFGGVALVALIVALVVTLAAADGAGAWLGVSLGLIVLALVGEAVLLTWGEREPRLPRKTAEPHVHLGPGAPARAHASAPASPSILLRCSSCAKTFSAGDDGRRPLATLCPHCGQRGMLDAPVA